MASCKPMTADEQTQWLAQWKRAAQALSQQRAKELREMTTEQAWAASAALLDLALSLPIRPDRETIRAWSSFRGI